MIDEVSEDKESSQFKTIPDVDLPLDAGPKADAEKAAFATTDYEKESRKKEHQRGETLKDILHKIVVYGLIIMGILLIIGIVIWAWHILAPDNLHWLSTEQTREIQQMMSGGLLAVVVSDYAKRYFK